MPPKSKSDEPADTSDVATAEELATALDELADLRERVDRMERAQRDADARVAAGAKRDDPVFLATTGRRPTRLSEGARQDKIVTENAREHLFEPAGDAVPSGPATSGVPAPPDADETEPVVGEGREDPASPNFEDQTEQDSAERERDSAETIE